MALFPAELSPHETTRRFTEAAPARQLQQRSMRASSTRDPAGHPGPQRAVLPTLPPATCARPAGLPARSFPAVASTASASRQLLLVRSSPRANASASSPLPQRLPLGRGFVATSDCRQRAQRGISTDCAGHVTAISLSMIQRGAVAARACPSRHRAAQHRRCRRVRIARCASPGSASVRPGRGRVRELPRAVLGSHRASSVSSCAAASVQRCRCRTSSAA